MFCSVITITKNNIAGLKATGTSIAAQTVNDYEWILIDGQSEDGTKEFLETTKAHWISEEDEGLYDAMNKGIERASGDYIVFLNAGDTFADAQILEHIQEIVRQTPYDFVYGDSFEREKIGLHRKPAKKFTNTPKFMFTHHQSMVYRRAVLEGLRYDLSYKIAADYKFTYQFLQRSKNAYYCPKPICIFESGGVSQTQANLGRREQFQIRESLNICPPYENKIIYIVQSLRWFTRRFAPFLYWR